ncbi:MAG: hypothetical protein ACK4ND_01585 [Cytophagaceae bacterium]
MEILSYNQQELLTFIYSNSFYELENLPISKHRAVSQLNNPRLDEDDKILFVAYDGKKVAGYFGVLPDHVFVDGVKHRIGWGTCFWVDENYKSQNVAASIFLRVIRAWKQRLFITNIVPFLEPVYQKTKIFLPTQYKNGLRCFLRFNLAEVLPPKKKLYNRLQPLLKVSDSFGNLFQEQRLRFKSSYRQLKVEYVNEIDSDLESFLEQYTSSEWMRRGKIELDWIRQYPWILEGVKNDVNGERYYFSAFSKRFYCRMVKLMDGANLTVGFMLLSVRNGSLTIPYFYGDAEYASSVAAFLYTYMCEQGLTMITTYNAILVDGLKNSDLPFILKKEIRRPYLISMHFPGIQELNFQDGDGDCVFT